MTTRLAFDLTRSLKSDGSSRKTPCRHVPVEEVRELAKKMGCSLGKDYKREGKTAQQRRRRAASVGAPA